MCNIVEQAALDQVAQLELLLQETYTVISTLATLQEQMSEDLLRLVIRVAALENENRS